MGQAATVEGHGQSTSRFKALLQTDVSEYLQCVSLEKHNMSISLHCHFTVHFPSPMLPGLLDSSRALSFSKQSDSGADRQQGALLRSSRN